MCFFFFFQAEDGIRDPLVTGVQTCALPICRITSRNYGGIFAIGIVPGSPTRIVLATAIGVFWAEIPSLAGEYSWRAVTTLVDGSPFPSGTYSGLAVSGSRVVVAAWGVDIGSHHYGVFHGDWSSGDLLLARSDMPPRGPTDFT